MLTSLIILIVLFIGAIIFYFYQQNDTSIDTIDNIPSGKFEDYSYETSEITTNLKDGTFIRIQFQIIVNSKQAHKEIAERDFQLKNITIKELTKIEEEDVKTEENIAKLESSLKTKLNDLLNEGEILEVLTTNKILQ